MVQHAKQQQVTSQKLPLKYENQTKSSKQCYHDPHTPHKTYLSRFTIRPDTKTSSGNIDLTIQNCIVVSSDYQHQNLLWMFLMSEQLYQNKCNYIFLFFTLVSTSLFGPQLAGLFSDFAHKRPIKCGFIIYNITEYLQVSSPCIISPLYASNIDFESQSDYFSIK